MNDILTNEEYTDVLTYKYQSTANSLAQQDWAEVMKHDDFSSKFDSTETVLELTNYHLSFLVAYYQYAFDKELQYESCARINELMPKVLVILKNEWDYQSAYGDGNDTFLQW